MREPNCSMSSRCVTGGQPVSRVPDKPCIHAFHMIIRDVLKGAIGHVHGEFKKFIVAFFVHRRSVQDACRRFHSYFPSGC